MIELQHYTLKLNNNMDKFIQSEQAGRALFKSFLESQDIETSEEASDLFDRADYYYWNRKGNRIGVEIKTRSQKYEGYDTHLLEVSKFNALAAKIRHKEIASAIYANFFGSDTLYLYSIRAIAKGLKEGRIKVTYKYCPVTTAADNGMMLKQVIEIPKSSGVRYRLIDNKWIKSE